MKSIRMLNDPEGFGLAARRFTVSTAGIIPAIERLAEEPLQVNLAVSLHAADDGLRDELVPINRRYPVGQLLGACRAYSARTRRRVTFEVALADGVNDTAKDAERLGTCLSGQLCHVNLIPLNPVTGTRFGPSPRLRVNAFRRILEEAGIPVSDRLGRGIEIQAGCGQLRGDAQRL